MDWVLIRTFLFGNESSGTYSPIFPFFPGALVFIVRLPCTCANSKSSTEMNFTAKTCFERNCLRNTLKYNKNKVNLLKF